MPFNVRLTQQRIFFTRQKELFPSTDSVCRYAALTVLPVLLPLGGAVVFILPTHDTDESFGERTFLKGIVHLKNETLLISYSSPCRVGMDEVPESKEASKS